MVLKKRKEGGGKKSTNILKIIAFLFGRHKYKAYICIEHLKKSNYENKKTNNDRSSQNS